MAAIESLLDLFCAHLPAFVLVLSVLDILAFGYIGMGLRRLGSRKESI